MPAYGFFGGPAGRAFRIAKIFANSATMEDYSWADGDLSYGDFVQIDNTAADSQRGTVWEVVLWKEDSGDIQIGTTNFAFHCVISGASLVEYTILKGVEY